MRSTCVALLVALSSIAHAGNSLDEPPFTAKPADLLAAAKAAPANDDDVVVLRHDEDIAFDAHGLMTQRSRWVYLITSEDGLENWGSVGHVWRPWRQKRPVIRARVISPSGQVVELAPSKITDEQRGQLWHTGAELPGAQPGCVVEAEITFADTAPAPGGRAALVEITADAQVTMSAPVALKAHIVERGLPPKLAARHAVAAGRETWTYRFDHHVEAERENDEPDNHYTWPVVSITTAPSWAAVAKAYASAVEPHLALPLPPELTRGATRDNAAAITAWLHRHVKFNDEDLTDAPLEGIDLSAVLRRGDADTNELGALLAALLRAAGFTPELVLVNRGWRIDFDRDRPALTSFDHVLVRVPLATGDLWIDPEDQDAIVGQLDSNDQGKLALAVTRGALVTVPTMPAANTIREVRTFTLAQLGRGDLREVTHEGGSFESGQRGWVRERGVAAIRTQFEKYVRSAYDGTLATFATTPPEDLTKPFELTLDVRGTKRAYTEWSKAEIYLEPSATFSELPWALTAKDVDTRTQDLVIHAPHVYEIENRIVVPDGFSLPKPAANHTRAIGPFRLIEHQRTEGKHTLIVTYRLEATATRLTPEQVTDARDAIALVRRDDAHFVFDNTGWSLVMEGKFREGLAELDRMVAANPSSGLHRARRAQALIYVGAGDAARREARKAVEVDPKNPDAYVALGWVLTHDIAGRRWAPGHDHAGARAALQQARKLDPKHLGAAVELASLLERDARGRKYERGSDLRGAAEAWRAANTLNPTPERGLELVRTLFYGGDAAGAEKAARALEPSQSRDPLLVAAIAVSRGTDAAIAEAPADDRDRVLHEAARMLAYTRHYNLMRKLTAAFSLRQQAALGWMQTVQRIDTPFKPTADPKSVALALALEPLMPVKPRVVFWDAKVTDAMLAPDRYQARLPDGMTAALLVDMLRSTATIHVDGDPNAWRVELEMNGHKFISYAARDRGVTKLIGAPYALRGVGQHVLRLSGKHDDAAARLLDWVVQDSDGRELDKLWGGSLPRDANARTLAATVLVADPDREVAVGTKCGATTAEGQLVCDHMAIRGYHALRAWNDLLAFATAWASRAPTSVEPIGEQITALLHLGRTADAEHAIDTALAKHPDEVELLTLRAEAGVGHVSSSELIDRLDAIVRARPTDAAVLNNVAWMKMVAGVDLAGALYDAEQAVDQAKTSQGAANTLAAIRAEKGELRDAVVEIHRSTELTLEDDTPSSDWYVLGRIYELAGLREDAIAAYQRVTKVDFDDLIPHTDTLAADRLKALGAKR